MTQRKNPWIAMGLSIIYPGLGHAFLGEMGRGLLYITIHSFLLLVGLISLGFLGLPALIFWIVAIIRAGFRADKINKGESAAEFKTRKSAVISFVITVLIGFIPVYIFPVQTYFSIYDRFPWEKAEVQAYLQGALEKKYGLPAQVGSVEYSFDASDINGSFEAEAILTEYPDVLFHVHVHGKNSLQEPISDNFVDEYIKKRHAAKTEETIQLFLEQAGFSHSKVRISGVPTEATPFDIEQLKENPALYTEVSISSVKFMDLNQSNKQQLSQEIWSVVKSVKQLEIKAVSFDAEVFHPKWDQPSFNERELRKQRLASIYLNKETPIHSSEDILPLIELIE